MLSYWFERKVEFCSKFARRNCIRLRNGTKSAAILCSSVMLTGVAFIAFIGSVAFVVLSRKSRLPVSSMEPIPRVLSRILK
jgi:hypothetical protein